MPLLLSNFLADWLPLANRKLKQRVGGAESQRCMYDDHNLISALSDIIKSQENKKKKKTEPEHLKQFFADRDYLYIHLPHYHHCINCNVSSLL